MGTAGGEAVEAKKPGIEEWLSASAQAAPDVVPLPGRDTPRDVPEAPPPSAVSAEVAQQVAAAEPELPPLPAASDVEVVEDSALEVTAESPEPVQPTVPRAEVVHFAPRPKGPPTAEMPAMVVGGPPPTNASQFIVEPPPSRELEHARRSLVEDWSRLDTEGITSQSTWAPVPAWTRAETRPAAPVPAPRPSRPPIFGGAALERIVLPPTEAGAPPPAPNRPTPLEMPAVTPASMAGPTPEQLERSQRPTPLEIPAVRAPPGGVPPPRASPLMPVMEPNATPPPAMAAPPPPPDLTPPPGTVPAPMALPPAPPAVAPPAAAKDPGPTPPPSRPPPSRPLPALPAYPGQGAGEALPTPAPSPSAAAADFFDDEKTPNIVQPADDEPLPAPPRRSWLPLALAGLVLGAIIAVVGTNLYDKQSTGHGGEVAIGEVADAGALAVVAPDLDAGPLALEEPDAAEQVAAAEPDAAVPVAVLADAGEKVAEVADAGVKVAAVADAGVKVAEVADAGVKVAAAPADAGAGAAGVNDFDALLTDAKLAIQKGRWRTAMVAYKKAVGLQPDSPEAREGLGIAMVMSDSSYRDAIPLLQEAAKSDPKNAQVWLALGLALQNSNREREAKGPYTEYLRLKPTGQTADEIRAALEELK